MPRIWGVHDWDGLTSSPSGCGWYRIILPLSELGRHEPWDTGWASSNVPASEHPAIIAGQRLDKNETLGHWRRLAMQSSLVYDIDDDVWNIRPSNWNAYQSFNTAAKDAVGAYAAYSDLVTVSTEPLAEIMRRYNPNVTVLPNHVPGWLLTHQRTRRDGKVVIGWSGGSSHSEDMHMIAGPVRQVLGEFPHAELHLLGSNFLPTFGGAGRFTDWIPVNEEGAYYRAIDFDIAIAPLTGTVFDESKSAVKALEAMALGIPVIASRATPYRDVVIEGVTGYLVKTKSEWRQRLRELTADADARAELGAKAREVARAHVIEAGWPKWADAYKELLLCRGSR